MFGAEFHLQSLALTMVFVSGVTLLCLVPAFFRFPEEFRPGLRAWIVGTALVTTTDAVFFTGVDIPSLETILLALAGLGVSEWLHALRLLNGKTRRLAWPYIVVASGSILSAVSSSYPLTALIISVTLGALYLGAAWAAVKIRLRGPSVGRAVLITTFATIGIVMLGRMALFMMFSASGAAPGFTTVTRSFLFIAASAGPFTGSLGFVLTCGERLGHRLLHLSLTDPLTGIPNRRAFYESLNRALASGSRRTEPVAVLTIDIDHFKRVNDEAGHATGDRILVEVANRLAQASRSGDTFGRLGGEEFGVVQSGVDLATAGVAAERLRDVIAGQPVTADGRTFDLTVSIGVAVSSKDTEDAPHLMARADRLLYVAKRRGRNQVATDDTA